VWVTLIPTLPRSKQRRNTSHALPTQLVDDWKEKTLPQLNMHLLDEIKKPQPSQIESTTIAMSFDSHVHENFVIWFSISSPVGDPLRKLNKCSSLLDAKRLLALSTPFDDEPLQCTVFDDFIEVIQDGIGCPLLEQEFMSTMGPSNHAQRINTLVGSPFILPTKAAIPHAVTSAASLLEAIQHFCAQAHTILPQVSAHNFRLHTVVCHDICKASVDNTGPPIMESELVITHWHFAPTWNGRHLNCVMPSCEHFASRLGPSPPDEPSACPLDEAKGICPVLNVPLECLAPDPLLSQSSIDIPASAVDLIVSPIATHLDQEKANCPTASLPMTSLAAASSVPTTLCFQSGLPLLHIAPIQRQAFHLFSPG